MTRVSPNLGCAIFIASAALLMPAPSQGQALRKLPLVESPSPAEPSTEASTPGTSELDAISLGRTASSQDREGEAPAELAKSICFSGSAGASPSRRLEAFDAGMVLAGDPFYLEGFTEPSANPWRCCAEIVPRILEFPIYPLGNLLSRMLHTTRYVPEVGLSETAIGIQPVPQRPDLLFEWNEPFLGEGLLRPGTALPTGAVWRPAVWVFGTFRSGYGYFDDHRGKRVSEWANRVDLFGQLNLSGTEQLLVGVRPLDEERLGSRSFSGYDFRDGSAINAVNAEIQTLFFEADFDELFPRLDPLDLHPCDVSFAIGRQPLVAQQGLLVNEDRIDAIAMTRNHVTGCGIQNLRISGVYTWNEVNRSDNRSGPSTRLYAILTEAD